MFCWVRWNQMNKVCLQKMVKNGESAKAIRAK